MPFDKISLRQHFLMRIATAGMFVTMGGALAYLAGRCVLDPGQCTTWFASPTECVFTLTGLLFGVLLGNAGVMLLELTTKPPFRMAINVPFVAANFQTALCMGLVAMGLAIAHATMPGTASTGVLIVQALSIVGFAMNLFFVVMTKMHRSFTENTVKELPKA